ncbi:type I secretion protein [Phaeobacter sp.]|uniref:calcium-binding protein n=1 Tax=Phaeobacter sp. TaxID=1902409 RepID=UPI0025E82544|nr:type I secretion protein [Phaeobacter sp.]
MIALISLLGIGMPAGLVLTDSDDDTSDDSAASGPTDTAGNSIEPEFLGTSGNDLLFGTGAAEAIMADDGNDSVDARGGDDRIEGNDGNDDIDGGDGDDNLFGDAGNDRLMGGVGDDFSHGGADDDTLVDGRGSDHLVGGQGDDLIIGSGIFDLGRYEDFVQGRLTASSVEEVDQLLDYDITRDTDTAGDTINAGAGDDGIIFGIDDTVTGGDGADSFETGIWLEDESDQATITDFTGTDDRLIYYYLEGEPDPDLEVVTRDNNTGGTDAFLVANGEEVVRLVNAGGDFNIEDHVTLIARPA